MPLSNAERQAAFRNRQRANQDAVREIVSGWPEVKENLLRSIAQLALVDAGVAESMKRTVEEFDLLASACGRASPGGTC